MHEGIYNIKVHVFQAFDGDSFLVTIYEDGKEINLLIDCGNKDFILPRLIFVLLALCKIVCKSSRTDVSWNCWNFVLGNCETYRK